jgi:hypothetical protein
MIKIMRHSKKTLISTTIVFLSLFQLAIAQSSGNFGLSQPQPQSTIPVGMGKPDEAVRIKKVPATPHLVKQTSGDYNLNNGWELAEVDKVIANTQSIFSQNYNSANWYNAVVPGTVLTTLVQQGVYPDPYMGLNNLVIPDSLCRKDWWYRIAFTCPHAEANKQAWLQFDGINYKADVWLNGKLIGKLHGAFVRGNFNITDLLKTDEKNILAVHIFPPSNPGIPHEQSAKAGAGPNGGTLCLDGPTFISSEGWDWVPGIRDRNIGLWQDVRLHYTGAVTLHDPQVITNLPLPDTTSAAVTIKAVLVNHSSVVQNCVVNGTIEGMNFSQTVSLKAGEKRQILFCAANTPALNMQHPALWWPNGYGKQNLYHLNLSVSDNSMKIADAQTVRFGVREFSYDLLINSHDKKEWRISYQPTDVIKDKPLFDNIKRVKVEGGLSIPTLREGIDPKIFESLPENKNPYLVIKVNGQKIFCKGGDWGMDDAMKRVERERLEPAFRLHKEANYNMIRNWTGESTEEVFYQLADEYGMLIWNDFWMSTEGYNLNPIDDQLLLDNVREVVKRFRNHPSIAIWCPRNEGYAPASMEDKLATVLAVEDGTRHYNGNSREMNLRQSGGWGYHNNPADYFTSNVDGFTTELGTYSIPAASSIRKFMKKEDQWPINDVWNYHDLHSDVAHQNLKGYLAAVDSLYGKAMGLDDFNKKVQLINYDSHRAMFEAWNSKLWNNTSGILLWMTHPAWPSMIWQTYSWDYETHGSYYGTKKACEPLHIQMNLHDQKVIAVNSSLQQYPDLLAKLKLYGLDGNEIYSTQQKIALGVNEKAEAFTADFSSVELPAVYMVRLSLEKDNHQILAENNYWKTNAVTKDFTAFNNLATVSLTCEKIKSEKGKVVFVIGNPTSTPAIGIKLNLVDQKNQIVLPAYFNDGYFTLLPGEKKTMSVSYTAAIQQPKIKTDGYNIKNENIPVAE